MPAMTEPLRIGLLVPTYRRNELLAGLLTQCEALAGRYAGPNVYEVAITDSDPDNPRAAEWAARAAVYALNTGRGFDDNLLSFWQRHADRYDYLLSISDDDLFADFELHPWRVIDIALESRPQALLFNHVEFRNGALGEIYYGERYYRSVGMTANPEMLRRSILELPPRHAGILYGRRLLQDALPRLQPFRETLHLYAVPLMLAAAHHRACFVDVALVLFNEDVKHGGAWADKGGVFDGLVRLLVGLHGVLPGDAYGMSCNGFWKQLIGPAAWLRRDMEAQGLKLPSPEDVLSELEAVAAGRAAAATTSN
jgi:hypothetical protein